jgi:hypothetical protein
LLSGIGRLPGDPVIGRCKSEHHRPNRWILSFFGERPHFLGSHAPVRYGPEKIVGVGDTLAYQNGVLSGEPEHPATETSVSRATRQQIVRRKSISVATHSAKTGQLCNHFDEDQAICRSLMA